MSQPTEDQYRPPKEQRWTEGMRTEPVRVAVRTEWRYTSDSEGSHPYGRGPWPFGRGGYVTESDVPGPYKSSSQDLEAHLHRAVSAFGDDKDLVVEVRLADDPKSNTAPQAAPASGFAYWFPLAVFLTICWAVWSVGKVGFLLAAGEVEAAQGWTSACAFQIVSAAAMYFLNGGFRRRGNHD